MTENAFTIILILVEIIFASLVLRAFWKAGAGRKMVTGMGIIFALWLSTLYATISNELFSATGYPLVVFTTVIIIPVVIGLLLNHFWTPFAHAVGSIPQTTFLKLQYWRSAFGVLFFFTPAIPQWFQSLGGGGDIAAGVAAMLAVFALKNSDKNQMQKIIAGNAVGILDFVVVLNLGIFVVIKNESPDMIFNLIPLYVVPIFILLHIFSLQQLICKRQLSH